MQKVYKVTMVLKYNMNDISRDSSPCGSYTPRSSFRPSSMEKDSYIDFEMEGLINDDKYDDCVVKGSYNMWFPRLPLQRQTAQTLPRVYYNSLAMIIPLQYVHIENELCKSVLESNDALWSVIERIYDDYCHRSTFIYASHPRAALFYGRFSCTVQYLVQIGRITVESAQIVLHCVEEFIATRVTVV